MAMDMNKNIPGQKIEELSRMQDSGLYLQALNEALVIRKDISKQNGELFFLMAESYYYLDSNNKAINNYKKAAELYLDNNTEKYIQSIYKISLTNYYKLAYDSAIHYINQSIQLSEKENVPSLLAKSLEVKGRILRNQTKLDSALVYFEKSKSIRESINDKEGLSNIYNQIGRIHFLKGQYNNAIDNYNLSLNISQELRDDYGIAIINNNLGNVYQSWGEFEKAIEHLQNALKYFEETDNERAIANCYNNIGLCYENLTEENLFDENIKMLKLSKDYHERALTIRKSLKDSFQISNSYINLGNVHAKLLIQTFNKRFGDKWEDSLRTQQTKTQNESFEDPLGYYNRALQIKRRFNDQLGVAVVLNNIGRIYSQMGKHGMAKQRFEQSLKEARHIDNNNLIANNLVDLAHNYKRQDQYSLALGLLNQGLQKSKAMGLKNNLKNIYLLFSEINDEINRPAKALDYYKLYVAVKDSITNEEKYKQISQLETIYETEKKEKEIQLLNKDKLLQQQVISQQKRTIIFISIGTLLIILFLLLVYKFYREKKKANRILEEQNHIISDQKKEITDSIEYASKIQSAILPRKELLDKLLGTYFILYLPKDIVSGDFYWVKEYGRKIITVAADCTGHGVPGAFMSMLGVAFLEEIASNNTELSSNEIIGKLREKIIISLHQQEEDELSSKDGMDLSMSVIDYQNKTIEFTGAYNSLIIIRDQQLIELKGDKMPVGIHVRANEPFTTKTETLQPNDMFYSFSDGFPDQIGGEKGRKFMIKKFKKLLLEIHEKNLSQQKEILQETIEAWKGENKQMDDILVMGLKI